MLKHSDARVVWFCPVHGAHVDQLMTHGSPLCAHIQHDGSYCRELMLAKVRVER